MLLSCKLTLAWSISLLYFCRPHFFTTEPNPNGFTCKRNTIRKEFILPCFASLGSQICRVGSRLYSFHWTQSFVYFIFLRFSCLRSIPSYGKRVWFFFWGRHWAIPSSVDFLPNCLRVQFKAGKVPCAAVTQKLYRQLYLQGPSLIVERGLMPGNNPMVSSFYL